MALRRALAAPRARRALGCGRALSRTAADDIDGAGLLLREYVERALYEPQHGYFTRDSTAVVNTLAAPLDYAALRDEDEYRGAVGSAYARGGTSWLTPVETFTPHYARAIARSVVERHANLYPGEPLQMLEVGGGNGTCAEDVLRFLRECRPELYATCRYVLLEISPRLAAAQRARLEAAGLERFEVHVSDGREWAERGGPGGAALPGPWFIGMLEVLDNLGHDKLRVAVQPDGAATCEEAYATPPRGDARGRWVERHRPLRDAAIGEVAGLLGLADVENLHALQHDVASVGGAAPGAAFLAGAHQMLVGMLETVDNRGNVLDAWVPTASWRLLRALCTLCPEHQFTLADFSWLPPQPGAAVNAPVVQTQLGGRTIDLAGDYLDRPGSADILFPTNFDHLATLVEAASAAAAAPGAPARPAAARSLSTAEFMRRWHDVETTRTRSGFNPLVDDFANTRVLVTGDVG